MSIFDPASDMSPTYFPNLPDPAYQVQLETAAPGITQVVQDQQVKGESWMDTLARSLPILAATYQQKEILSVQVERAKQGLPPLNASQFAAGVNVGLSPDVIKMLMLGALGIGAAIFLSRK